MGHRPQPRARPIARGIAVLRPAAKGPAAEPHSTLQRKIPETLRRLGQSTRDWDAVPGEANMEVRQLLVLSAALLAIGCSAGLAQGTKEPYVRVAEIEIDPARLEAYQAAVK